MRIVHCLLALSVLLSGFAHADAVVTVFGLPLGGKLRYDINICPSNMGNSNLVCWKNKKPSRENGYAGVIRMPNPDNLPAWAVNASFFLWITEDGELKELTLEGEGVSRQSSTIEESISRRFGLPTNTRTIPSSRGSDTYYATWERQDIGIQMTCGKECLVRFVSSRLAKARNQHFIEMRKADAARPLSP